MRFENLVLAFLPSRGVRFENIPLGFWCFEIIRFEKCRVQVDFGALHYHAWWNKVLYGMQQKPCCVV